MSIEPCQFKITRHPKTIFRLNPTPNDCVINAMEVIDLITPEVAAMMRIIKRERPIDSNEVEAMFGIASLGSVKYTFKLFDIREFDFNKLRNGYCMYMMYQSPAGGIGHVFVIAHWDGQLIYIDPQLPDIVYDVVEALTPQVNQNFIFGVMTCTPISTSPRKRQLTQPQLRRNDETNNPKRRR